MAENDSNAGANPFAVIDPKLTVFALANGMDLSKSEGLRRLEWFSDRLERGLEVSSPSPGVFDVAACAWKTKTPDEATRSVIAEQVEPTELFGVLERGIVDANAL